MKILEIKQLPNGAHRNQTGNFLKIPDGWIAIPDDFELPKSFPFVDIILKDGKLEKMNERNVPEIVAEEKEVVQNPMESLMFVAKQYALGLPIDDDDKKLMASGIFDAWTPGKHQKGEIYNTKRETWECTADYDNDVDADIAPGNAKWHDYNRELKASKGKEKTKNGKKNKK